MRVLEPSPNLLGKRHPFYPTQQIGEERRQPDDGQKEREGWPGGRERVTKYEKEKKCLHAKTAEEKSLRKKDPISKNTD